MLSRIPLVRFPARRCSLGGLGSAFLLLACDADSVPHVEVTPTLSLEPPAFSEPAGFRPRPFELRISARDDSAIIHYTLDGSTPAADSPIYEGPIRIDAPDPKDFRLAGIRTTPSVDPEAVDDDWAAQLALSGVQWAEPESVFRGTVVRAMALDDEGGTSRVTTRTYFVDEAEQRRYSLPVVSLATDPENFFDDEIGIYVPGALARNNRPDRPWHSSGNFRKRGDEWERPVHFELFTTDGESPLSQDAGVRVHGGGSSSFAQKSLRIYARKELGEKWLKYPVFPDSERSRYKRVLLSNSGNDWPVTLFRDALMQSLVDHLPFDTQNALPSIVFLNGEYWGIHLIREYYDHHYLGEVYGVDPDELDILSANDQVERGSRERFVSLLDCISRESMEPDSRLEEVNTMMDMENFLQYQIAEIYFNNTDWPCNNIQYWRLRTDTFEPDAAPGHDGRWRWLMYDTDYGFGYGGGSDAYAFDTLTYAITEDCVSADILVGLMENQAFRERFVSQFANHLNTAFSAERVLAMIDRFHALLEPEIDEHIGRWGQPASRALWEDNVEVLRRFAKKRVRHVRGHISEQFGLNGTYDLTADIQPAGAGTIQVNEMPIDASVPGIDENPYPWSGAYFRDIPLQLEAKARVGYHFVRWSDGRTSPTLEWTPTEDTIMRAEFEPDE